MRGPECGVSRAVCPGYSYLREDYEKLLSDFESLTGKYRQAQSNYDKALSKIERLKDELIIAKAETAPIQDSLNRMTSERSNWVRKLKRAGVKSNG